MCVDDMNLVGKYQNINPLWNVLVNDVDLGRANIVPCSFGLHSTRMSNTQGNCGQLQIYVWIQNLCYFILKNLVQTCVHVPMVWKVMQWSVWTDCVNWRTQPRSNCTKLQLHALTTISWKKEMETVGALPKVCSQNVLKFLYSTRIGGPDILFFGP